MVKDPAIISAYRRLLRTSLQVVRHATPGRYQVVTILRDSFRNSPRSAFVPRRIEKTLTFLRHARDHQGKEVKIVRNILHIRWWREHPDKLKPAGAMRHNTDVGVDLRHNIPAQFDATLTMLNESLDICLRI